MWSLGTPFHSIGLTCSRFRLPFGGIPHVRHTHMVNNSGCASTTTICILWIHVMKDTGTGFLSSDCSWLFQLTTLSHLQWVLPLGDVQHSPAEWINESICKPRGHISMDWFKGKILTGKPHDLHGKIYGFRLRFSPTNQSIEYLERMTPRKLPVELFKTPKLTIRCNDPLNVCPVAGSRPEILAGDMCRVKRCGSNVFPHMIHSCSDKFVP